MTSTTSITGKPDLCIVTDATGSMGSFLTSICESLPQIVNIVRLTTAIDRISILSYYDWCDRQQTKWSGWHKEYKGLRDFAASLVPDGGGDAPEAAKTAIVELLKHATNPAGTIVIWYADAPPHHITNKSTYSNLDTEKRRLGAGNFDWTGLCMRLAQNQISVYPVINVATWETSSFFAWMAHATGGALLHVGQTDARYISTTTINLVLALLGADHTFDARTKLLRYPSAGIPQIKDEIDNQGYLPHSRLKIDLTSSIAVIETCPSVATNLKKLVALMRVDETYRNLVYGTFTDLLTPPHIESLTTNSVFGAFWRAICERRKDDRREILLAQISNTLRTLPPAVNTIVKKWLDESYNREDDIRAVIGAVTPQFPALVLDATETWKAQELLEITHSCNPAILARVSRLMAGLRVVDAPPPSVTKPLTAEEAAAAADDSSAVVSRAFRYLPLALPNNELFNLLPHLMCPGTMVSLRPGVIFAAIAVVTGCAPLLQRALTFLGCVRGKWFDKDMNENYAFGFVKLMLQAHTLAEAAFDGAQVVKVLTPDELSLFTHLRNLCGVMINGRTNLTLQQPRGAMRTKRPDYKINCKGCGHDRSFTLMAADGRCGMCHFDIGSTNKEPCDGAESYWYECRSCCAHYAVIDLAAMKVSPKCHFCREGTVVPTVSCVACCNKYVDPSGFCTATRATWVCPPCATNGATESIETTTVPLYQLVADNAVNQNLLFSSMGLNVPVSYSLHSLFSGKSVFAVKDVVKSVASVIPDDARLVYDKKPVLNTMDVLKQTRSWVESGKAERGECALCFGDQAKHAVHNVCGRKGCTIKACDECMKAWYGTLRPGTIINPATLSCPFCKRRPTASVMQKHNQRGCELNRVAGMEFDNAWYYAWCVTCYKAEQYMEKTCAGETPDVTNFECEQCKVTTTPITVQNCPTCDVAVEKRGGCAHITCTCGAHWCWTCGQLPPDGIHIYTHIYACRGRTDGREVGDAGAEAHGGDDGGYGSDGYNSDY